MHNRERELLRSKLILKVIQIYLNDFKDIILAAGLITYRLGKKLVQSWITKITQFPENVVESLVQEFKHFFDLGAVPDDYDYSFLSIHFWDYIIINAKCYGEDFASTYIGHETIGLSERRFYALILSFMIGAGTHQLYLKWQQPILPPPPYYSSTVVALVVEFICPKVGRNRRKFLFYPIGSATLLCIAYGIFYEQFDFIYLFSTIVAVGFTFKNLQGLLGKGCYRSDYATAHDHIALPINSMYNQLICTILFGTYIPGRAPHEAIPDAFEEQYTMIAH
uniref:Uncharacterized protein n=1 Tax=Elaeophora elaphi TaxID=1147741 RepID=A0A0R3RZP3_9BILA